jgi:hypothetical protein
MARNHTIVMQHTAEFKGVPFGGPGTARWTIGHWQTQETEPFAISTLARDLLEAGWRELGEYDMRGAFGTDRKSGGLPVHRAFVKSEGSGSFGVIATLTDKRKLRA